LYLASHVGWRGRAGLDVSGLGLTMTDETFIMLVFLTFGATLPLTGLRLATRDVVSQNLTGSRQLHDG